mmetsp:Transcript_31811/g.73071  ORF Transcript_31811/g.73071 Transcript_31811/m.73071 type:complete len:87 (-) Transcript_31811:399-659(-)
MLWDYDLKSSENMLGQESSSLVHAPTTERTHALDWGMSPMLQIIDILCVLHCCPIPRLGFPETITDPSKRRGTLPERKMGLPTHPS